MDNIEELRAQLQDQLDTSLTFQDRNAELETQVLQTKKSLRQMNRTLNALQEALRSKDQEIALLRERQADKPDTSVAALTQGASA